MTQGWAPPGLNELEAAYSVWACLTTFARGTKFLVDHYEDGDGIYIFGFSRGAYSARSLAGLIRNVGLVKKEHAPNEDADDNKVIEEGYELYRTRDDGPDADTAIAFRDQYTWGLVPIKFVGVWDTVGSLGIPFGVQGMINNDRYAFHDTRLSGIVEHSYHALAVDEYREDYEPTLWKGPKKDGQTMEQVWFVGAHSDVGGSSRRAFGQITLRWMMEKAQLGGDGLEFRADLPETTDDYLSTRPSDSHGDMFRGLYAKLMRFLVMVRVRKDDHHLRPVEQLEHGEESVHHTVRAKIAQDTGYSPQNPGL